MSKDRFSQLMGRKLAGETTPEETVELETLVNESPQSQFFFEIFTDYWKLEPRDEADSLQAEVHFQQILAIAEKESEERPGWDGGGKTPKIFRLNKWLVAAGLVPLVLASYFLVVSSPGSKTESSRVNVVAARPGSKMFLQLPDGSKVWLNSASKLEYKSNFNNNTREVTLEGEAFFDVVKNKKHPFVVHTSDIDVRVLGTAFNVKSYPGESYIETTLIRGLIEVTNKKDPKSPKVFLYPHDKLVFDKQTLNYENGSRRSAGELSMRKPFIKSTVPKNVPDSALTETSWMYNKLVFDGETMRENMAKMERWYNVKIRFRDNSVGNTPIHYPLQNETIEEALKALQYIEPFRYRIRNNEIEIWKK